MKWGRGMVFWERYDSLLHYTLDRFAQSQTRLKWLSIDLAYLRRTRSDDGRLRNYYTVSPLPYSLTVTVPPLALLFLCLVTKLRLTLLLPHGLACQVPLPWNIPGKNTGVGCDFLLQGIFQTQGLNLRLLHWQAGSLPVSPLRSPIIFIKPY